MAHPSTNKWPGAIRTLHWAMALALLAMVVGGRAMTAAAEDAIATGNWEARILGLPIFEAYQLHKSVGLTLWVLVMVRLGVRLSTRALALPDTVSRFEMLAAKGAHAGLYGLMLGLPITGWLVASTSPLGLPTRIFDLFAIPHAPLHGPSWEALFLQLHWAGSWALVLLATAHIAAALKHHFIAKDDVLRAMLPGRARP